jgi:hypothetical protein
MAKGYAIKTENVGIENQGKILSPIFETFI